MSYKNVGSGSFGVYKKDEPPIWPVIVVCIVVFLIIFA